MTTRRLLAALACSLVLPGCVSVTSRTALDDLEDRIRAEERVRSTRMAELEGRVRELENRNQYLEGYLGGLAAGGGVVAASPGSRPGLAPLRPAASASPAASRDATRFGGIYRQALGTNPPKLDPAHLEDTTSHRVGSQIMEGLVEFDADLEVVPLLATGWEVSDDKRTYTFRIRDGVRFHHGRKMVAGDFVYSYGRILDPATASVRTWLFDNILGYAHFSSFRRVGDAARSLGQGKEVDWDSLAEHRERLAATDAATMRERGHPDPEGVARLAGDLATFVEARGPAAAAARLDDAVAALDSWDFLARGLQAPDDRTLVIRLEKPFAPFLSVLAMVNAAVVPKEKVEELGDEFAFHPIGTGPFRFVSWDHDVKIVLEANDDYFAGRPYLDGIEYRVIPDPVTRLTEFEVGNLESVNQVPDEKYEDIKSRGPEFDGVLEEKPILHVFYLGMNPNKPPFDDVRVRRAFNHAVDKRAILDKIRKGRGKIAVGPLPPGIPGYDPDLEGYGYDPARARQLLAEAGYDPPSKLGTVEFWFNTSTGSDVNAKIAEVFQENLKVIGVDLNLNSVDWATYLDKVNRCEPPIMRLAWVGDYPDADNFLYVLFHSSTIGQANAACYSNPEIDRLLEQARELHDQPERLRIYRQAQRQVVEDAPWIPIFHQTEPFLRKKYVRDAVLTGRGADAIRYKRVWLDRSRMDRAGSGR